MRRDAWGHASAVSRPSHTFQNRSVQRWPVWCHAAELTQLPPCCSLSRAKGGDDEPKVVLNHQGCFGESVLTGLRRHATFVANTPCQTLALTKTDMVTVFSMNPKAARRIINAVLEEDKKKVRLARLTTSFLIGAAEQGGEEWAAMVVQRGWMRYVTRWLAEPLRFGGQGDTPATLRRAERAKAESKQAVEHLCLTLGDDMVKRNFTLSADAGDIAPMDAKERPSPEALKKLEQRVLERVTLAVHNEFDRLRAELNLPAEAE